MAKVLITGGAGYIGSVLTEKLLSKGHQVKVIDNFMFSNTSLIHLAADKNLEVIFGNACDEQIIKESLEGIDFIYPLACLTGAPLCDKDPKLARIVNLEAVKTLESLRNKDQKIIFPNTNSGYGKSQDVGMVNENSPLNPVSLYGELKNSAEKYLLEKGNAITFRLATVFGTSPRMRLDLMVNDFVYKALNDGVITLYEPNFRRNFLYIRDAVDGFIFALENFDRLKDNAYNLGLSDANLTKNELCLKIKEKIPKLNIIVCENQKDPDQRDYLVDNSKIENAGFKASTSIDTGIDELIRTYAYLSNNRYGNV